MKERYEVNDVKRLLQNATKEEIEGLTEIIEAKSPTPESIIDSFWRNCQSVFGYFSGSEPSYKDIVCQVANKLKIDCKNYHDIKEIEIKIAQKVLETVLEKVTPEQRKEMEEELHKIAQKFDDTGSFVSTGGIFAALTAAQLSGFGVYLLASTTLGTITSILGFSLPFTVYTTMSSAISVIIGPVGWIGAGLFAIWKITGPKYKRLIPAIIYIFFLRSKQSVDNNSEFI